MRWLWLICCALSGALGAAERPNIVLIFADDLGYGDVGCYGSRIRTPNLDRLAAEGIRFTDFYVGQAVCTASRAALLTGCYPNRIGLLSALGPRSKIGIHDRETTLAEVLKTRGYATAAFGKWHLGDDPRFLPTRHGFDEYFGLPYSNDMWPHHPTAGPSYPPLPLIEGEKTIERMPDQTQLTTWYTERAVAFIAKNRARPFFLYVPHSMPHVPLFVSDRFKTKSGLGLYGDVIQELDWSVGQIVQALAQHQLERRTLVIFISDNGPWLSYGAHAGSAGPFREGKATVFEGGVRVPMIARWPGTIPAGRVCGEMAGTIDLFPTIAKLAGARSQRELPIDGKDIWPLLAGRRNARSPHAAYFFYWGRELQALRSGPWKLHFPHEYRSYAGDSPGNGRPGTYVTRRTGLELYHLESDPGETKDLSAKHPKVIRRLGALAEKAREDLGDSLTQRTGKNVREPGRTFPHEPGKSEIRISKPETI